MKCSQDQLHLLGPLAINGKLEELRERMLAIWPPDSLMDEEDVGLLTMLLRVVRNIHGERGLPVYLPFSDKLKSPGERRWLRTLSLRAEIVQSYEGLQKTFVWLESLRKQIPPPNDGVVSLVIGRIHFSVGDYSTAREYILEAVNRSLRGIEWFRLDALNEMANCLVKLGESRLAFEYARTLCIESFKLGRTMSGPRLGEYDLYQSVYTLALIFGQVEYAIDIRHNLADRFRLQGIYTASSEFASDVGYRFAQLGAKKDAVVFLKVAAQDAEMGSNPSDPVFAASLHLLAKYVDKELIISSHLEKILEFSKRFSFPPMPKVISATQEWLRNSEKSQTEIAKIWQQVVIAYNVAKESNARDGRLGKLLVGVHTAALVSCFLTELGQSESAYLIEQTISMSSSREAIFVLVREKHIDKLLQHSHFKQALEICNKALLQRQIPLERFTMRDFAARCHFALGDKQQAYSLAKSALSDWHRVLEGLYSKQRKLYWLKRGVACLSCALSSISEPVSWMMEDDRRKALFDLIELQKARLASDMMTQTGHVPGAYDLSKEMSEHGLSEDFFPSLSYKYPEWMPVCLLQLSALVSNHMTTVVHEDPRGPSSFEIDLAPLRSMLQLPIDPYKQLLATASPLCFEGYDISYCDELYSDLILFLSKEKQNECQ